MLLYELFDSQDIDYVTNPARFTAEAVFSNDTVLELDARKVRGVWHVNFEVDGAVDKTGAGIEFEVFGAVVKAMKKMVEYYRPDMMYFSSKGESRTSLYRKLAKRLGDLKVFEFELSGSTEFFLCRELPDIGKSEVQYEVAKGYSFPFLDVLPTIYIKNNGEYTFDNDLVGLLSKNNQELIKVLRKIISPILPKEMDEFIPSDEKTRMTFSRLY